MLETEPTANCWTGTDRVMDILVMILMVHMVVTKTTTHMDQMVATLPMVKTVDTPMTIHMELAVVTSMTIHTVLVADTMTGTDQVVDILVIIRMV